MQCLTWFLDDEGMCYETIKGWLNVSAFVAVGQRLRNLLMHDHLRAKMRFFQAALRWEDGSWKIRDEMRASAFHVIWMMHYYHPNDEGIDLLYQSSFTTHPFLTDANAKWPDPVGISPELLLLYADNGMTGKDGKPIDWENQAQINRPEIAPHLEGRCARLCRNTQQLAQGRFTCGFCVQAGFFLRRSRRF